MINYPSIYWMKIPGILLSSKDLIKKIEENTKPNDRPFILDYGCGLTTYLFEIAKNISSSTCFGVDINEKFIEVNEKIRKHNELHNISFETNKEPYHLNYPDKFFDVIISGNVIEHNENPKEMLIEVRRLLKSNGILIISTPYKYHKKLWRLSNILNTTIKPPDHVVEGYTFKEMKNILDKFDIVERKYIITFFLAFMHDIMTIMTFLYRKRLKLKGKEFSVYEKIIDKNNLSFKKGFKYYIASFLGLFFYLSYILDNQLSKIYKIKGYELSITAKKKGICEEI